MILPTKHGSVEQSLIAIGALIVNELREPRTLDELFLAMREMGVVTSFEQFYRAVVVTYMIGALSLDGQELSRSTLS